MTIFRAGHAQFLEWGANVEQEIDLAQVMAADPFKQRKFRLIGSQEFMELTGATDRQWKQWTKQLLEAGQLPDPVGGRHRVTLEQVHEYMDLQNIRPSRPAEVPRGIRIAVANFKGGAAKSTTTYHFGTRLAMRGYKVLMIDLDGQATLSRMMALQPYLIKPQQTFAAAIGMQVDSSGEEAIGDPMPLKPLKTFVSGMDIIPAGMAVTAIDMELMQRIRDGSSNEVYTLFQEALSGVDKDYDFILMDFQPSFSLSQLLVLFLADSLLLPLPTETPDFAGTGDFLKLAGRWLGDLQNLYGEKNFDPVLVLHVRSKARNLSNQAQSDRDQKEREEDQVSVSNAVHVMAGRVFGMNRPRPVVEDRPVVGACLANLKSVYEADNTDYDLRAVKSARLQYDTLLDRVVEAVNLRWEEVVAKGGQYG